VDKRVLLKHTGTYVFDFQAQEQLYKDLHAMSQANGQAAPVNPVPAPALDKPVVAKTIAASKKDKKKAKA
jgi:hypothetical protein